MGHTAPDWSWMGKVSTIYSLQDQAELAARIGSIVTFDRRGNVILLDSFEDGFIRCSEGQNAGGVRPVLTVTAAKFGSYAAFLDGGDAVGDNSFLHYYTPILNPGNIGIEFSFTDEAENGAERLDFRYYNGTREYQGQVRYNTQTSTLEYVDHLGAWLPLLVRQIHRGENEWHTMKAVFDTEGLTYVRVMLDDYISGDLSATTLTDLAASSDTYVSFWLYADGYLVGEGGSYMDGVIVTQNEV